MDAAGLTAIVMTVLMSQTEPDTRLSVLSSSAQIDRTANVVRFEILYNRVPDFFTLDPGGRQADSFQINLDILRGCHGMGGSSPYPWETIIRGEEIHMAGDIPIRDHINGPSSSPWSGGWGPILGSVPYSMDGTLQRFEAPFSMLNYSSGNILFTLEIFRFGEWQARYRGIAHNPSPGPAACVLAGAWWFARRRRR